jgi:hypothetical protein
MSHCCLHLFLSPHTVGARAMLLLSAAPTFQHILFWLYHYGNMYQNCYEMKSLFDMYKNCYEIMSIRVFIWICSSVEQTMN